MSGHRSVLLGIFLAVLCLAGALEAATPVRQVMNFNREWKFQLGDHPGADAAVYDDSVWQTIGLPHSFSIPYFGSPKFYVGYGWYRKHFHLPLGANGKRIFLEFDAAFQDAQVFVNGTPVGEHKGGYTGFSFDISSAVKGGDNVVAVRLNNLWNPQIAPRAGEHVFSGGIYRDVRLVVTNPLHVAWYGTFVTTPQVSKAAGTVNVKTEVMNDDSLAKSATVVTRILDAQKNVVAKMESTQEVLAGSTTTFDQTSASIPGPHLWHPDHPYLYSVATTVLDGNSIADTFTSPLGFRWFQFTADKGFFLNGEHYYFKGANVHQDHAGWGDAVTQAGARRDVQMVKDAGFDFIRGSHYPHSPALVRACDEIGVLFWSENCLWGTGGYGGDGYWTASAYPIHAEDQPGFDENVAQQLREEIRMYRNDPSVIVWSMSNEPFFSNAEVMPQLRKCLSKLVALTHQLDPTRPAAIGGCQRGDIDKLGDVAGYNGDGATLFINPGIPSVVTEFESGSGKYGHWETLAEGKGDNEPPYFWRYPWRSGEALWCAFDHGSIAGRGMGEMGIVDYFRLPKRNYYWWRNELRHIPEPAFPKGGNPAGLKLTADHTVLSSSDGTDDCQIISTVVDAAGNPVNSDRTTTLTIESGPGEFPTGRSITFNPATEIGMNEGRGAIEFRSYYAGKTVIRATSSGLKDATLAITSLGDEPYDSTASQAANAILTGSALPGSTDAATSEVGYGLNNPTQASAEAAGHAAPLADDGNGATNWQPPDSATSSSWQVDLERYVDITQAKITFPREDHYRYRIETSPDEVHWTVADDESQSNSTQLIRTTVLAMQPKTRYVRVIFPGQPAAISEFTVRGRLSGQ